MYQVGGLQPDVTGIQQEETDACGFVCDDSMRPRHLQGDLGLPPALDTQHAPTTASRWCYPVGTTNLDFWSPELGDNTFCCFKLFCYIFW